MTLIIAEAGVNHNGEERLALELIDVAAQAGSDIVKFQTFKSSKLVAAEAPQADYQRHNTGKAESQREMLSRLELDYATYVRIARHCEAQKIEFLSTAFDLESLKFLTGDLGQMRLKIPSGELTNAPFVLDHARCGLEMIVSSGMASLADIENALSVIAFGLIAEPTARACRAAFAEAYTSSEGRAALLCKVTLMHCTTEYPAPMAEINLTAMGRLAGAFGLPCGYSDHSQGFTIPIAAVALGATMIEKHFTLNREMEGPDHKASLEPDQLGQMITAIRNVEVALGDGVKRPMPSEVKNMAVARKSLVTTRAIKAGEVFSEDDLSAMRPGDGFSPMQYWDFVGTKARRDYAPQEAID
ncbi:N-acetylneuraminate synthase [uncultured Sulfitobacter sp.]|uniref:N-acetylneuraminate synthase n=1 Tax=uncultured Sulfitobacter sp. TaxID=191468 RepID=UPI0030D8622F